MKFILTYVRQSKHSRKRMGKATVVVIDPAQHIGFEGCETAEDIESRFEANAESADVTVKVVDIREAA